MVIIAAKKYTEEKVNAVYDGDIYTIINLTPVIHKDDRQEQKNEIEKTLYTVFSKYTLFDCAKTVGKYNPRTRESNKLNFVILLINFCLH